MQATGHLAVDQDCYKVEHNPLFCGEENSAEHVARSRTSSTQTASSGGHGRAATGSMLARSEHVGDGSDSESEGPQRRMFRGLLNQIRFKVRWQFVS